MPEAAELERLQKIIATATRPVLVLGAKVAAEGARDRAVALAEALGAPALVAPLAARSPFPEDHPLFAGFLPPVADTIRARLEPHDLALVLGAPVFTYHVPSSGPPVAATTRLVQVVDDPRQAALAQVGESIVGSVGPVIDALLAEPRRDPRTPQNTHTSEPTRPAPPTGMTPEAVLAAMSRLLPDDAVIVEEAPTHRNAMHEYLPITADRDFYVAASGGLGWGMPAAVGIAMATPGRRVVCIIGDGSSLYSVQALWTAAQHGADVLFVVLNNRGYAAMKAFGNRLGVQGAPGLDLPGVDFEQLAAGFGVPAAQVSTPGELLDALGRDGARPPGPRLLDVLVESAAEALY